MAIAPQDGNDSKYMTDFHNENVLKMKNTICTPHLGASTNESEENCAIMAARQTKEYLETGNIKNSVNFPNAILPYTGKTRVTALHKTVPNKHSQNTVATSQKLFQKMN